MQELGAFFFQVVSLQVGVTVQAFGSVSSHHPSLLPPLPKSSNLSFGASHVNSSHRDSVRNERIILKPSNSIS